jgi:hypothetical protein
MNENAIFHGLKEIMSIFYFLCFFIHAPIFNKSSYDNKINLIIVCNCAVMLAVAMQDAQKSANE